MKHLAALALVLSLPGAGGCVSRPPTIAHVHIGHAITGVHVTPNQEGYMVTAERRGAEAVEFSRLAAASNDLAVIKRNVAGAVKATDSEDNFGVKQAIVMASNHVTFAATSDDASVNVQQAAPIFASHITRIVERCELIVLLGKDVEVSSSVEEASVSVAELGKLTRANVSGDESNADQPNADGSNAPATRCRLPSVAVWPGSVAQGAGGHGRAGEPSLRYRATMVSVQSRASAERQVGVR